MHGLLSGAPTWVSEDEGQALQQVARWAQGTPGGGEQVRLGVQLLGEEIPAGPGTCSLLEKGERESGQIRTNSNPPPPISPSSESAPNSKWQVGQVGGL